MDKIFDVIIIGGGPAGYLAAERAAQGGLTAIVFEKRAMGGVCLNEGCIPTKTYLNSVKILDYVRNGAAYGVSAENVVFDHAAVKNRKDKVVKTLVSGVEAKMKAHKVIIIKEAATIKGRENGIFAVSAGDAEYFGRNMLIAAGSEAVVPPIPGVKEGIAAGYAVTSREILEIDNIPQRLAVIGGGVIGLEMAAYFAAVGSEVNVIEMLDNIAGFNDLEISGLLMKDLQKKGINFHMSCRVVNVTEKSVAYEKSGKTHQLEADMTLVAIGRRPSVAGLGLENIGIYTENGAIVTDNNLRTNISGVYAIGDVNGKSMLAHTAYREAEVAINHILGKKDTMRYDAIPGVIYTSPEVAGVGETEESAKAKGLNYSVKKLSMRYAGRFVAENEKGDGLCKLIIDKDAQRLIGAHLIGSYASEIIYGAAMMIESRWPIDDLKEIVFPHPTVSEIIRETLFAEK